MAALRCEQIKRGFDGVDALNGVTLQFPGDGLTAIIGPNGAGKTTLLNILTGFLKPEAGKCFVGAVEITRLPPHRIARMGIGRTFQELRLILQLSVLDNVMLGRRNQHGETLWGSLFRFGVAKEEEQNREAAISLLRLVGVEEKALDLAGELSYGQQKLLTLACCLATEPQILLLDEPVAGVHPDMASQILELLDSLKGKGKLVVIVEHDIRAVRLIADQIIVMDEGRVIAEGAPGDVLERPEIMEAYVA